MLENSYLLLGLAAAMLYAVAASSIKTATERGVSSLKVTLLANLATAAAFLVFVPWRSEQWLPAAWWPSLIVGGLFFAGQLFTVLALKVGHASIATPVLGSKVVMVALLLAVGFAAPVSLNVWIAAAMSSLGIMILAWPDRHLGLRQMLPGIALSLLAAFCFGLFDILTQFWSRLPGMSFGLLMPPAIVFATLASAIVIMLIEPGMPTAPRAARLHLVTGVGLLAGQAMIFVSAIGYFGDAAGLNVTYSSRGIWSVLLVGMFSMHFSIHERLHRGLLIRRLIGATLIAAAVLLIFM